jgi:F0F1-type ATP synthase assembly protein I
MPQDEPRPDAWRYASIGTEFVVTFVLVFAIGHWLDGKLGTGSVLALVGGLVGFVAALYRLIRQAKKAMTNSGRDRRKDDRPEGR